MERLIYMSIGLFITRRRQSRAGGVFTGKMLIGKKLSALPLRVFRIHGFLLVSPDGSDANLFCNNFHI